MTSSPPPREPRRSTAVSTRTPATADPEPGIELIAVRRLVEPSIEGRIAFSPGDRPLVAAGERFEAGAGLAEILRDGRTREIRLEPGDGDGASSLRPGDHRPAPGPPPDGSGPTEGRLRSRRRRERSTPSGELLYELDGRWRLAVGDTIDLIEAPVAGTTSEVRNGVGLTFRTDARGTAGASAFGAPVRGRLEIAPTAGGEVRAAGIDVARKGTILVVGARVDAETLIRARAMGVRGVIVGGLAGKERRDLIASGERQLAGRHRLEPFALLVLDGTLRRPISGPHMEIFRALAGRTVGILVDPPALVFDEPDLELPLPRPDQVRIRSGPRAGAEGRWAGLAGVRRFGSWVHLEAGRIELASGEIVTAPLADLERYQ